MASADTAAPRLLTRTPSPALGRVRRTAGGGARGLELRELAKPIAEHMGEARETHLLMNNCYRDYAVQNAAELRDILGRL